MNFWSRTSSKTFNRYSEFHASREAIIRRLTTLAVTEVHLLSIYSSGVTIEHSYSR